MISYYEARAAAHAGARDAEIWLSTRISRARLATFIPGAACVVWAMANGVAQNLATLAAGALLLLAFAVLVFWHARVDARAAWYAALHETNIHALARIGRAWDRLPPAGMPAPREIEHHPFANDLDLFGRASLMQWLGPAATASGASTLQAWLLYPAPPHDLPGRQHAVLELVPDREWRERLSAYGRMAADVRAQELERFLAWAESGGAFSPSRVRLLQAGVLVIVLAMWALMALHAAGVVPAALWLLPLTLGMILSFATAHAVHGEFDRAGAGQHAFARYADLFAHAVHAPGAAPALRDIRARLTAAGAAAPDCMRRLNRIQGFAQLRAGAAILHFPIQAVTLWDFHVFFMLDRWRTRAGPAVRGWMDALGELDALSAFARMKADNPEWCFPEVHARRPAAERRFVASNLGHPLLPADRRVGNDVEVGPPGTLLLITGSNMSGKSTLLRAIGLNTVLAQAGAPACATRLELPPVDLETSIRVQDSLEQGLSYFMAALARLKGVVDRSHGPHEGRTVLYLLDEILQGTNTVERSIAVRAVARHLLRAGAIGVMTTHDLGLAAEEPINEAARLVHFSDTVDEQGAMSFDYRLRPGLATSRNALRLMNLIGIDLTADEGPRVGDGRPDPQT